MVLLPEETTCEPLHSSLINGKWSNAIRWIADKSWCSTRLEKLSLTDGRFSRHSRLQFKWKTNKRSAGVTKINKASDCDDWFTAQVSPSCGLVYLLLYGPHRSGLYNLLLANFSSLLILKEWRAKEWKGGKYLVNAFLSSRDKNLAHINGASWQF